MFLFEYEGRRPTIADDAFVAATATIIGDVTIESGASVWYGAVLRGDDGPIVVRAEANVQDGSVLHCPPGVTTEIGRGATVAHRASCTAPCSRRRASSATGAWCWTVPASGRARWSPRCRSSRPER